MTTLLFVFGLIIVATGVYFGTIALNRPAKYVDLLRPRDGRGQSLKVVSETDLGLECKKTDGITHHFIKIGPGWTFNKGGRMTTRFFGLEATPYTARVDGPVTDKIPLDDYLRTLWEDDFYDSIPDEQKKIIEMDKLGVTIEVARAEDTQDLPALPADIANEEEDTMLRRFARMTASSDKAPKMSLLTMGGLMGFGALAMYFLMTSGVV